MGRWWRFSDKDKDRMLRLYDEEHLTYQKIAQRFGIDPTTVKTICRKHREETCRQPSRS